MRLSGCSDFLQRSETIRCEANTCSEALPGARGPERRYLIGVPTNERVPRRGPQRGERRDNLSVLSAGYGLYCRHQLLSSLLMSIGS